MSNIFLSKNVSCIVCNTSFSYEYPSDNSNNKNVETTVIATGTLWGAEGKMVDLLINATCPNCGIINQFKESYPK